MTVRLALIADDLTGACDSAAPFASRKLRTVVALPTGRPRPVEADVIALDTDSRASGADVASDRVQRAVAALREQRPAQWFKKVDSTLRGNPGAEIEAALAATGLEVCVLTPAFPANQRRVVDGRLVLGEGSGEPGSLVADVIARQFGGRIVRIALDKVERGVRAIAEALSAVEPDGPTVVVLDASSDAHLRGIARAAARRSSPVLLAGSAGLAGAYADAIGGSPLGVESAPPSAERALVLVGSLHPRTRQQLSYLRERLRLPEITLPTEGGGTTSRESVDRLRWEVRGALTRRGLALLSTPTPGIEERTDGADRAPVDALAALISPIIQTTPELGIVASGGDTIAAVCRRLDAGLILVEAEVLPGMPRGRILDGDRPGLPIVTKSGGFGPPEALLVALRSLLAPTLRG